MRYVLVVLLLSLQQQEVVSEVHRRALSAEERQESLRQDDVQQWLKAASERHNLTVDKVLELAQVHRITVHPNNSTDTANDDQDAKSQNLEETQGLDHDQDPQYPSDHLTKELAEFLDNTKLPNNNTFNRLQKRQEGEVFYPIPPWRGEHRNTNQAHLDLIFFWHAYCASSIEQPNVASHRPDQDSVRAGFRSLWRAGRVSCEGNKPIVNCYFPMDWVRHDAIWSENAPNQPFRRRIKLPSCAPRTCATIVAYPFYSDVARSPQRTQWGFCADKEHTKSTGVGGSLTLQNTGVHEFADISIAGFLDVLGSTVPGQGPQFDATWIFKDGSQSDSPFIARGPSVSIHSHVFPTPHKPSLGFIGSVVGGFDVTIWHLFFRVPRE